MGSSSTTGASSGSGSIVRINSSSSEEDLQQVMDQRKRKRMLSNRESARRSRMRKQKHLDDLMSQVAHLREENTEIRTSMNFSSQLYSNIESENCILRAQLSELSHRLDSLNEILSNASFCNALFGSGSDHLQDTTVSDDFFLNHWSSNTSSSFALNQPIMDMAMY